MWNEEGWFDIRPPIVGDDQGLDYLGVAVEGDMTGP